MRKSAFILVGVALVLFLGLPCTADAGTAPPKTIKVNCSKGQSIQAALADVAPELVVEITGVCAQYVTITRDNVTLRGVGGAVIDGTSLGDQTKVGITVFGASKVAIENLTVQGMTRGISMDGGAGATLTNVVLQDNRTGLIVFGSSSALLADCTAQRNSYIGFSAWNSSSINLASGTVVASNNLHGFVLSGSSITMGTQTRIEANNNGGDGIALQLAASALLIGGASVTTNGNGWAGIELYANSSMAVGSLESTGNNYGVLADGSWIGLDGAITGNDGVDVELSFGARAEFNRPISVGTVTCEPSVLTRGDVSCPELAAAASSLMQARPQRTAPRPHGLFHPREVLERETPDLAP
jgi:parallel beta-helix repeat protein